MINKWNEIVLEPLAVKLASKGLKLLQKILEDDLNKSLKEIIKNKNKQIILKQKKLSKTVSFKRSDKFKKVEDEENEIDILDGTDFNAIYQDKNFKKNLRLFQSISACLVDNCCNEYSVLTLNTDFMHLKGIYQAYEKGLFTVVLKTLNKYSTLYSPYCLMNKLITMQVFQEKLLNSTKIKICEIINQVVFDNSIRCLIKEIDTFIKKLYFNNNNDIQEITKIAVNYFKLHTFNIDPDLSGIFKIVEDHIKTKENNDSVVLYIIANFINSVKDQAVENNIIKVIQESNKWYGKVLETQDYYNKQVFKEFKRRKINKEDIKDLSISHEFWQGSVSTKENLVSEILELISKNKIDDMMDSMML